MYRRYLNLREPLKIHFGEQANLFAAGLLQTKTTLSTDKADLSSLPDNKNSLLVAQKQLSELPLIGKKNIGQNRLCLLDELGRFYGRLEEGKKTPLSSVFSRFFSRIIKKMTWRIGLSDGILMSN